MDCNETSFSFPYLIPVILLIEGFISIGIEILTIRQLLPVAGGSVVVTSLVIGVFLLFLALGYQQGGKKQLHLQKTLRNNFLAAAIWLGVGLSYFFISIFFSLAQNITGPHIVYQLIAYLLIIIAPLVFLLGQTLPITMNLVKQNKTVGAIGGNALGLSTLGSFLGAVLSSLLLMDYLGVAWTVFIIFILLITLYFFLSEINSAFFIKAGVIIAISVIIFALNVVIEKKQFVLTNSYANYQITPYQDTRTLLINNSSSSFINHENKGFPYIEAIKKIIFYDLALRDADILVLGAGGFSLSSENDYKNHFTYVDIDGQLKKLVVPNFTTHINGILVADDARHFIRNTNKLYQAIVVDTYSNRMTVPSHLLTYEYMSEIKQKLAPKGTVIFNIIARPTLSDVSYSQLLCMRKFSLGGNALIH